MKSPIAPDQTPLSRQRLPVCSHKPNRAIGGPGAVVDHVENADETRPGARLDDVELALVGRKAKTVGPVDVAGYDRGGGGPAVHAIDVGRQLRGRLLALVIAENPEGRIGE